MDQNKRNSMLQEAQMQMRALKTIRKWLAAAIGLSTMGAAVTYWSFACNPHYTIIGIIGILLTVISLICALIINYGMRNGQKNVEKILALAK